MNLKPCRQCGGEAKLYKYRTYIKAKERLDYKYYVSCRACRYEECDEGFGYLTEQEAINAWNTGWIIRSRGEEMDSLKPCLCRDSEPRVFDNSDSYCVTCIKCGRQTNMYESEKEAIGAWNRKAWQTIPLYKRGQL